jgi:glutathione S-transferase
MTYPILYSFRRCPYAMRARMALMAMGHVCVLREVVLRNKPDEMLRVSPKGTVPVLQLSNGTVLEESLEIITWAISHRHPSATLNFKAPLDGDIMTLIADNDGDFKYHLDRYKYANRYAEADPAAHLEGAQVFLKILEQRLSDRPYLGGYERGVSDIAIGPFVRQFANADRQWFDASPYQATRQWLDEFVKWELFLSVMTKYPPWASGHEITFFPSLEHQ